MIVAIYSWKGNAVKAEPYANLPPSFPAIIGRGDTSDAQIVDQLERRFGWRLVNVIPVTGSIFYDKELWLRRDDDETAH